MTHKKYWKWIEDENCWYICSRGRFDLVEYFPNNLSNSEKMEVPKVLLKDKLKLKLAGAWLLLFIILFVCIATALYLLGR